MLGLNVRQLTNWDVISKTRGLADRKSHRIIYAALVYLRVGRPLVRRIPTFATRKMLRIQNFTTKCNLFFIYRKKHQPQNWMNLSTRVHYLRYSFFIVDSPRSFEHYDSKSVKDVKFHRMYRNRPCQVGVKSPNALEQWRLCNQSLPGR